MIEAYKGFEKFENGIACRGYLFEEGKTYTLDEPPILCHSGFHACLDPLNVLNYYTPPRAYTCDRFGFATSVYLHPGRGFKHWYNVTYPYETFHVGTEYHKVYIEGDVDIDKSIFETNADDTKICTNKIRIGEKIDLDDIMQIHLKLLDKFEQECAPWLDAMNCGNLELNSNYKILKYCDWLARKMVLPHVMLLQTRINNKCYDDRSQIIR